MTEYVENEGIDAILWSTGSGLFREEFDVSKATGLEKIIQYQKLVIIQPGSTENNKNNVIKFVQDSGFDNIEIVVYRERTFIIGRKQ